MHGHTEILTEVQGDKQNTETARFKEAYEDNNSGKEIVKQKMRDDDEATAVQLHALLVCTGYTLTLKEYLDFGLEIPRQRLLPVDMSGNKAKRLEWAQQHQNDNFADVIWTDECSVQMESHSQFCCRKCGEAPKAKPRYIMDTASQHHFIQ